ncbi:MAG TPA: phosphatidylinositol kinase [Bacteroidales bacterium]|nr:phosphatidylinositol kinase [Bacteroidales bacterium]
MRKGAVYSKNVLAGILTEKDSGEYVFTYENEYFYDITKPGISLTLPKNQQEYTSKHLFPFFFNMISEGANRAVQSKQLKIDENDFFGLLLATAQYDTIGAITVREIT